MLIGKNQYCRFSASKSQILDMLASGPVNMNAEPFDVVVSEC